MQIHGDDMIASRRLQHIGHELCGDGSPGSILFVLARVGEVGDYGGDAAGGGGFAGVDYDEEFHEAVVDVARGGGLEDEYWDGEVSEDILIRRDGRSCDYHLHRGLIRRS